MSKLLDDFRNRFTASDRLYHRAQEVIAGGVTHDSRFFQPFPIAVKKAEGPVKWSVDDQAILDYWMGHGALLLGHSHPEVVAAVQEQAAKGTHYGSAHTLEVEWAELICRLLPSADLVRFVSSGSEAMQLALRLARAYTNRHKVLKFSGHFHGWHDDAAAGGGNPAMAGQAGVAPAVEEEAVLVPPGDLDLVKAALEQHSIAAVLVEPSGGSWGAVPVTGAFLRGLAELTKAHGVVLVFDEVVTGFRVHQGGAQALHGVTPDLTCLGKVVAGGLPGGAVAGKRAIMELLEFRPDDPAWQKQKKVSHFGTFNANPLSAAAGVTTLKIVEKGNPIAEANARCKELTVALNGALREMGVTGVAYDQASMFHIALGVDESPNVGPLTVGAQEKLMAAAKGDVAYLLRRAMLLEGVDLMRAGGFLSAAHQASHIEQTVAAFRCALRKLLSYELINF